MEKRRKRLMKRQAFLFTVIFALFWGNCVLAGTEMTGGMIDSTGAETNTVELNGMEDVFVKKGNSVTFRVNLKINAFPALLTSCNYRWYYAAALDGKGVQIQTDDLKSNTLTIPAGNIDESWNERYFYCEAEYEWRNSLSSSTKGTVKSSQAKLTVYSSPDIIKHPKDQYTEGKKDAVFSVSAAGGNPSEYTYQWYRASSLAGTGTPIEGATESIYRIPAANIKAEWNGTFYYCAVSNGKFTVTGSDEITPTDMASEGSYIVTSNRAKLITAGEDASRNPQYDPKSDTTKWKYVYLGMYPQTEVTGAGLTTEITRANYDSSGNAVVNGTKYYRISKGTTTNSDYFGDGTYRYFKWEQIRWRVLEERGSRLFLAADRALSCKKFHSTPASVAWKDSAMRTWLNGTFYEWAFSSREQKAICQIYGTEDSVSLLSAEDVANKEYGFCEDAAKSSNSRILKTSDFAHCMGAYVGNVGEAGESCWWWLSSAGSSADTVQRVQDGAVDSQGIVVNTAYGAVVPAISIEIEDTLNPKYDAVSDTTEWSYVYFGSYPQSEVKATAELVNGKYDENGNVEQNQVRYRRIKSTDTNSGGSFGNEGYRYFKWDPIKWRVLKDNGDTLLVMADTALDCKDFSKTVETRVPVEWKDSTLRAWLNETFYRTAFQSDEQAAVVRQTVPYAMNPLRIGKDAAATEDFVYLLSVADISNREYGFPSVSTKDSNSRKIKASPFAAAMGGGTNFCQWWLRQSGTTADKAFIINAAGNANNSSYVDTHTVVCVPVLNIDKKSKLWTEEEREPLNLAERPFRISALADCETKVQIGEEKEKDITFSVQVQSDVASAYNYQWYYAASKEGEGVKIPGASSQSLTIPAGDIKGNFDGRHYYCVVSNDTYTIESSRAKLTVYYPPEVEFPKAGNVTVKSGEAVTFEVTPKAGNPSECKFQWYYTISGGNKVKINNAESPAYTIPSQDVTEALSGREYYCEVTSEKFLVETGHAKLTVKPIPEPDSEKPGEPETEKPEEPNSEKPEEPNSENPEEPDSDKPEEPDSEKPEEPDSENPEDIYPKPTLSIPSDKRIYMGQEANFLVTVSGDESFTYTYQWYYAASEAGVGVPIEGEIYARYTLQDASEEDEGFYYCVVHAENEYVAYDVMSAKANLAIYKEPDVIGPFGQSATAGEAVEFSVTVSGGDSSDYTYQWYYAKSEMEEGLEIYGEEESAYRIAQVKMENAGYYYCIVNTDMFEVRSGRVQLIVFPGDDPGWDTEEPDSEDPGEDPGWDTEEPDSESPGGDPGNDPGKTEILKAPSLSVKIASSNAVKLTWSKISKAEGYSIYRAEFPKGNYKKIKTVKDKTSYVNGGLKSGKTYVYKVAAYKGKVAGKESKAVSKKILGKISTPKLKLRITANETFTLSWNLQANTDKVEIWRKVDQTGKYVKWKTVSAKNNKLVSSYKRYTIGHAYFFKIRMYDMRDKVKIYSGYSKGYGISL